MVLMPNFGFILYFGTVPFCRYEWYQTQFMAANHGIHIKYIAKEPITLFSSLAPQEKIFLDIECFVQNDEHRTLKIYSLIYA